MKTTIYTLLLLSIALRANTDLDWVNEQIEAIKPKRVGISPSYVNKLKDPVVLIKKVKKSDKNGKKIVSGIAIRSSGTTSPHLRPLRVETIINKRAYINGKWYSENEKVRGKKIVLIQDDFVLLRHKKRKIRLFVNQKNDKIKITTR